MPPCALARGGMTSDSLNRTGRQPCRLDRRVGDRGLDRAHHAPAWGLWVTGASVRRGANPFAISPRRASPAQFARNDSLVIRDVSPAAGRNCGSLRIRRAKRGRHPLEHRQSDQAVRPQPTRPSARPHSSQAISGRSCRTSELLSSSHRANTSIAWSSRRVLASSGTAPSNSASMLRIP